MNNRTRSAGKVGNLPGIRRFRLNEIDALRKTADALHEKRLYAEELNLRNTIADRTKKFYGEDAPESLDALSDLAFSYQRLYRFDEALAIRKDTLEKCRELFGGYHRATAMAMYFTANTLSAMGRYHEVLSYDYETYMDRLELLGTGDMDTIRAAANLAASYADTGSYKEALFYIKKAREYVDAVYDGDNDETVEESLDIAYTMATILEDLEDYEGALELYKKVKNAYEERFGPEHGKTVMLRRKIALVLSCQGKNEEAWPNLKTLLAAGKQNCGTEDSGTLRTMTGLACVLDRMGEYEEAKKLRRFVLDKKRIFCGEKHPGYIMALMNWAYACHLTADTEQGRLCIGPLEQALAEGLVENAESKMNVQDTLVRLYLDSGEYEKATALAAKMIDSAEYHYFYKKEFLADRYDTAKLAFEKAGDPEKAGEQEYRKTHRNELIRSGKPLCGMKLKAREGDGFNLTKGKIYELLGTERLFDGSLRYSIIDDEEFGPYLYAPEEFDVVEEGYAATDPD